MRRGKIAKFGSRVIDHKVTEQTLKRCLSILCIMGNSFEFPISVFFWHVAECCEDEPQFFIFIIREEAGEGPVSERGGLSR